MAKRVVGNCPRCGMPIYESGDGARKSCLCAPLADTPYHVYPYPVQPQPYYAPPINPYYQPPLWPTITCGSTSSPNMQGISGRGVLSA